MHDTLPRGVLTREEEEKEEEKEGRTIDGSRGQRRRMSRVDGWMGGTSGGAAGVVVRVGSATLHVPCPAHTYIPPPRPPMRVGATGDDECMFRGTLRSHVINPGSSRTERYPVAFEEPGTAAAGVLDAARPEGGLEPDLATSSSSRGGAREYSTKGLGEV